MLDTRDAEKVVELANTIFNGLDLIEQSANDADLLSAVQGVHEAAFQLKQLAEPTLGKSIW